MWRLVRRVAVTVAGGAIVAVGVLLLALPGPGLLVIVAGLAVLATEYAWARRALRAARARAEQASRAATGNPWSTAATLAFGVLLLGGGCYALVQPHPPYAGRGVGGGVVVAGLCVLGLTLYELLRDRQGRRSPAEVG